MLIHALQGVGGPALVAELAVVVILDDDRAQRVSPGQQGFTPSLAHGHAQGELVRGRDVDQPGAFGNRRHLNAFAIDRHADHLGTVGGEQQAGRRIAGVFHGHQAAGLDQHSANQVQRLLRTVAHHHVLVLANHPARKRDMPGDGTAQGRETFGLTVKAHDAGDLAQCMGGATAPVVPGEQALAGGAANEVITQ
ncbi:hypothetical protein D3C85_785890 [compost metagenome]